MFIRNYFKQCEKLFSKDYKLNSQGEKTVLLRLACFVKYRCNGWKIKKIHLSNYRTLIWYLAVQSFILLDNHASYRKFYRYSVILCKTFLFQKSWWNSIHFYALLFIVPWLLTFMPFWLAEVDAFILSNPKMDS